MKRYTSTAEQKKACETIANYARIFKSSENAAKAFQRKPVYFSIPAKDPKETKHEV